MLGNFIQSQKRFAYSTVCTCFWISLEKEGSAAQKEILSGLSVKAVNAPYMHEF